MSLIDLNRNENDIEGSHDMPRKTLLIKQLFFCGVPLFQFGFEELAGNFEVWLLSVLVCILSWMWLLLCRVRLGFEGELHRVGRRWHPLGRVTQKRGALLSSLVRSRVSGRVLFQEASRREVDARRKS